ncbi:MAG TPA: ABATE domain-containing protein [Blastocatellia bacterium]|nr:ABATE domain-containing protein [Blastocatellia bacterium]
MAVNLQESHFKLLGGGLSLDFVNTVGGRSRNAPKNGLRDYRDAVLGDKLSGYMDMVVWSRQVGVVTDKEAGNLLRLAEKQPEATAIVFERGLRLREAIYRLFRSVVEGWQPEAADLERLNQELAVARSHERLIHTKNDYRLVWDGGSEALDCLLWPLAQSATELLTSGDLSRIKQCGGDQCGWLFFDTSRNRSRQWCSMKDCGNISKVRRFRQRKR